MYDKIKQLKMNKNITLTRTGFRRRYKRPDDIISEKLLKWRRSVDDGKRAEVMLAEIPFGYHESENNYTHFVYLVSGYKIKLIVNSMEPTVVAAYSPLVGGFIFSWPYFGGFGSSQLGVRSEDESLYSTIGLAYVPYDTEPLDDATSRLVLMADCIPTLAHNLIQGYNPEPWQFKNPTDDMILNLVSCIKQQPQEKRDRLLSLYDKFGPPEGPLGEALTHIDKFRTF
jgi:hypothetical protein